jgi:mannose-6-phosphate isomerase-like protein (cupin superfamily)
VTNSYVLSEDLHTAVGGLDNVAVIVTHDAVLVAPRQVSAELKPLVAALSEQEATKRLTNRHRMAMRRWGQEDDVLLSDGLNMRVLNIKPGQYTEQEPSKNISTHLIVVHGKAEIEFGGRRITLENHGSTFVDAGLSVRISNGQNTNLQIVEVRVGSQTVKAQA